MRASEANDHDGCTYLWCDLCKDKGVEARLTADQPNVRHIALVSRTAPAQCDQWHGDNVTTEFWIPREFQVRR